MTAVARRSGEPSATHVNEVDPTIEEGLQKSGFDSNRLAERSSTHGIVFKEGGRQPNRASPAEVGCHPQGTTHA